MMRWDSFGRSAAFAACAALGWMPWIVIGGPRALYLVGVTSMYVAGLGGPIPAMLTAVAGGGLLFARLLGTRSPLGMALAIWAFFLVQSFFFLLPAVGVRERTTGHPDPFEEAHARAMEVLERSAL